MCTEAMLTTLTTHYYYCQGLWGKSEADAEKAVKLEPNFIKAYARFEVFFALHKLYSLSADECVG